MNGAGGSSGCPLGLHVVLLRVVCGDLTVAVASACGSERTCVEEVVGATVGAGVGAGSGVLAVVGAGV